MAALMAAWVSVLLESWVRTQKHHEGMKGRRCSSRLPPEGKCQLPGDSSDNASLSVNRSGELLSVTWPSDGQ